MRSIKPWLLVMGLVAGCADIENSDDELGELGEEVQTPIVYTGNLWIAGCTPPAADILVTAIEAVGTEAVQPNGPPPPPDPIPAEIIPTNNLHHFLVRWPALKRRTSYSISATMTEAHCAKVAWKGPHSGLITTGVAPGLRIDAYAMRTQTEVLAHRGPNHTEVWVGIDAIDLEDANGGAIRDLRWRTDVPGAKGGQVQIAAAPFHVGPGTNVDNQVPLLTSFNVSYQTGNPNWGVVPGVDIAAALMQPPCDLQQNPNGCPVDTARDALHIDAMAGAPLYVRVVPIRANGTVIGDTLALGIASTIQVAHVKLPTGFIEPPPPPPPAPALDFSEGIYYLPPLPEHARGYNQGCYQVTAAHNAPAPSDLFDYWGQRVKSAGHYATGAPFTIGGQYCFAHYSGTLDDIVSAISGLVDAVGDLINEIGKIYAEIKEAVIAAVADVITDLGLYDCTATCRDYLRAGLDAALASMGIPPSLPNFDELCDQGLDYLVKIAAEESGVPVELIEVAREVATEALQRMKESHNVPDAPWLAPDDGFRPSRVMMFVKKNAASTLSIPGDLRFSSGTTFHGTDVRLPIHSMASGWSQLVTVQLLPDFSAIPPPPPCTMSGLFCFPPTPNEKQLYYEDKWFERMLAQACEGITATGYDVGFFGSTSTPVYLPGPGMQLQWLVPPSSIEIGYEPYKNTCP